MHKFLLTTHRILGTLLSVFFLAWFLSGFVMLFHQFPKIGLSEKRQGLERLLPLDSLHTLQLDRHLASLPDSIVSLQLKALPKQKGYELMYQTQDGSQSLRTDSQTSYTLDELWSYAKNIRPDKPIERVELVEHADTWIPYGQNKLYPLYKFYYQDEDNSELYVSPQTGDGVQLTTQSSRLWAYLGAIPHWIYFYQLRQHREAWSNTILVLSGLGTIMCIAGIYLGIRSYWKSRRKHNRFRSPYKRWSYRWHHILGFFFGALVSIFIFSGFMSIQDVPTYIIPIKTDKAKTLKRQSFLLKKEELLKNIEHLLNRYKHLEIKQIEYKHFGDIPFYKLSSNNGDHYFRITPSGCSPLDLNLQDITQFSKKIARDEDITITRLEEYDNYYIDRKHELALPVYRVIFNDEDRSSCYINPQTAEIRYYNQNSRLHRILYQGLHSWIFSPIISTPWLWWAIILIALISGTALSWTSIILSWHYLKRKFSKK